jgi:hypothetical protein
MTCKHEQEMESRALIYWRLIGERKIITQMGGGFCSRSEVGADGLLSSGK